MDVKMALDPRTMPDGVVLVLSVRYENQTTDKVWTYAALKTGGRWFLTGNAPSDASWAAVERWLERDSRQLVRVEILTRALSIWPVPVAAASPDLTKPHPMDSFAIVRPHPSVCPLHGRRADAAGHCERCTIGRPD
jgi:hypothetical protein